MATNADHVEQQLTVLEKQIEEKKTELDRLINLRRVLLAIAGRPERARPFRHSGASADRPYYAAPYLTAAGVEVGSGWAVYKCADDPKGNDWVVITSLPRETAERRAESLNDLRQRRLWGCVTRS